MGVVLDYFDCLLRSDDFETLNEGHWINDNILSFVLEYMRRTVFGEHSNILFLDPSVTQLVKLGDYTSVTDLMESLGSSGKSWIFCIVNDSMSTFCEGTHWSLLVLSPTLGEAYHLDTLQSDANYRSAVKVATALAAYYQKPDLVYVKHLPVVVQNNSCDCGIYTIVFLELICSHLSTNDLSWRDTGLLSDSLHELAASKRGALKLLIRGLNLRKHDG
ncbi:unnamed protein product [Dicrocoelium dendriticum]|nr:unnamed protein product [Dicrocoelium dendriticum]